MVNRPMLGRPAARSQRFTRPTAVGLGIVVAIGLFIAVFPWYPVGADLEEGDRVPWTLTAPRALSFDSTIRTEQVRAEAAAAVPDVYVLDPAVRERELAALDRQLEAIKGVRAESGLAASARESAIRDVAGVQVSQRSAQVISGISDPEWDMMTTEARAALGRALSGTLQEKDLEASRQQVRGFLSPLLTPDQQTALTELMVTHIVPTLVIDTERTNTLRSEARASTPPVHVSRARGDVLVTEDQQLTAADVELLEEARLRLDGVRFTDTLAAGLLSAVVGLAVGGYVLVTQPASLGSVRRVALLVLLLVLPVLGLKFTLPVLLPDQDRHFLSYALPLAAAPMAAAVLLDVGLGVLLTILLSAVAAFITIMLPLSHGVAAGEIETAQDGTRGGLLVVGRRLCGGARRAAASLPRGRSCFRGGVGPRAAHGVARRDGARRGRPAVDRWCRHAQRRAGGAHRGGRLCPVQPAVRHHHPRRAYGVDAAQPPIAAPPAGRGAWHVPALDPRRQPRGARRRAHRRRPVARAHRLLLPRHRQAGGAAVLHREQRRGEPALSRSTRCRARA